MIESEFCICICTFRRPHLLHRLLGDINKQTVLPGLIVIVDGDSASGQVLQMVDDVEFRDDVEILYVPSNHSNLPYQRYLGWLAACKKETSYLLYLDDDLRLNKNDVMQTLLAPLKWEHENIAGVTAETSSGIDVKLAEHQILLDRKNDAALLVRIFGTSKNFEPGSITPVGNRVAPIKGSSGYAEVKWLQGRVMAYSYKFLDDRCFSDDLFALADIQCGLGEDTFLSRQVGAKARLIMMYNLGVEHPDDALPNSYPIQAYHYGYAVAYSRRFLNNHYRPFQSPTIADRLELVKSYVGNSLVNWWNVIMDFKKYRFSYALGFTFGALRGLLQSPTAQNLTPHVNWRADAEQAISQVIVIQGDKS